VNQVDTLLLVLLIPFALRGYWRGFCRESLGLAGLIGGAAAAATFSPRLAASLVARHLLSPLPARPVAFAAIFVAVTLAANIAGLIADRLVRALLLGGVNRSAGALFGFAKGAALCGFLLLLLEHLVPSPALTEEIDHSRLGQPLVHFASTLLRAGEARRPPAAGQA
jgi:membrane protein required for colicin V production